MHSLPADCSSLQQDLSIHRSWNPQKVLKSVPQGHPGMTVYKEGLRSVFITPPSFVCTFPKTLINFVCVFCESFL